MLLGARAQARSSFEAARASPPEDMAAAIQHAEDVATILRQNVVQATNKEKDDTWSMFAFLVCSWGCGGWSGWLDGRGCAVCM